MVKKFLLTNSLIEEYGGCDNATFDIGKVLCISGWDLASSIRCIIVIIINNFTARTRTTH